jgi:hypothetical protein
VDEVPLITAELSDEQALALVDSRLHGNKSFLTIIAARLKPDQELEVMAFKSIFSASV